MAVQNQRCDDEGSLEGTWQMLSYALSTGAEYTLDGLMILTGNHFVTVHFITGPDGPRRGSGEGGPYEAGSKTLVFRHRYFLSLGEAIAGVPSSPNTLKVEKAGDEPREECTYRISDATLQVYFPSGNIIKFRRLD